MKRRHMFGLIIIMVFVVFSCLAFGKSLTPYVSLEQAKEKKSVVQVKGVLVDGKVNVENDRQGISFHLQDEEGTVARVVYPGLKPDNMEHAPSVVVIGKYEAQDFQAEKILVKCPSKYQEQGG